MTQPIYDARAKAREFGATSQGEYLHDGHVWASGFDKATAKQFAAWCDRRGVANNVFGVKGGFAVEFWDAAAMAQEQAQDRAQARAELRAIREACGHPGRRLLAALLLILGLVLLIVHPMLTLLFFIGAAIVWHGLYVNGRRA